MNPDQEQLQLFRTLRGAPATILLLLMVRGTSMTGREINLYTGYDSKTITNAHGVLEMLGLIQNNGHLNGWSIRAGSQLLLPFMHLLEQSYPQPVDKLIGNSPIIGESPINSPSSSSSILEEEEERRIEEDRKISDQLIAAGIAPRSKKYQEIMNARLDLEFVTAHCAARLTHPNRIPVGHLIRKLLDGDPPPRHNGNGNGNGNGHHIPAEYQDLIVR